MEKLMNIDEVAEMLGVTKGAIYAWVYKKKDSPYKAHQEAPKVQGEGYNGLAFSKIGQRRCAGRGQKELALYKAVFRPV